MYIHMYMPIYIYIHIYSVIFRYICMYTHSLACCDASRCCRHTRSREVQQEGLGGERAVTKDDVLGIEPTHTEDRDEEL